MSDMTAADVLAAHQMIPYSVACECWWHAGEDVKGRPQRHAEHVLAELAKAGYAVVKLPERGYHGCWPCGGGGRVRVTTDGKITDDYAIRETAAEVRLLAAALLAAAAAAEEAQA